MARFLRLRNVRSTTQRIHEKNNRRNNLGINLSAKSHYRRNNSQTK